ncbi:hypothetical protein [Saccharopolyspora hordei]|uniref:Uncharacterized protein n=1 Tax=Saccharopolyspora hordei TaxID=1838 RepID=A0A853AK46_9PSEU|nr:hypothetical protein [Saccharopolyspora hordei]NYI83449.1 hypothetical protein [Saccharopolyspora hordei]
MATSGEPVRLGFGRSHKWSTGEVITISEPEPCTKSNVFERPPAGKR